MFRKMRRANQELSLESAREIVSTAKTGVLGVTGENGYPYTVPLNTALVGNTIYFHCAKQGYKLDGIKQNNKVSFTFVVKDDVLQSEYATSYRSAHVFGKAYIVENDEERQQAFRALCVKFCPEHLDKFYMNMRNDAASAIIVGVNIEHISGKASKDLL